METGSRLLILSPEIPAPAWITRLSQGLQKLHIYAEIFSGTLPEDYTIPVLDLHSDHPSATLHFNHSTSGRISVLQLLNKNKIIWQSELAAFRNEDEFQQQSSDFLLKAIRHWFKDPDSEFISEYSFEHSLSASEGKIKRILKRDNWHCAIVDLPFHEVALTNKPVACTPLLPAEYNVLRADPFGVKSGNDEIVFYERQNENEKGVIASFQNKQEHLILEQSFHLSYPFLIEEEGELYCIPEQHESGRLDLYRYLKIERKLVFVSTILDNFAATDPTIFYHNGKYWLFCTHSGNKGENSRLHLFYSEKLQGKWISHPLNPLKITLFGARPGGAVFMDENILYRPGQDSTATYGGALNIFRIDRIDENDYSEKLVNRIEPSRFGAEYSGIHTISPLGNRTLVDLKTRTWSLRNLLSTRRKK